jgi:DNA-binding NarL/FixJ family response regulator
MTTATETTPVRVLIADDQTLFRTGVARLLSDETDMEVVAEAADGEQAVRLAGETKPDLVLMDVRMPNLSGIEATRQIAERHPGVRVLILTSFDTETHVLEALRAGAGGYVLKDAAAETLTSSIRSLMNKDRVLSGSVADRMMSLVCGKGGVKDCYDGLSSRELEILKLFAPGLTPKQIAYRLGISEKTVRNHVSHIYEKLEIYDRSKLLTYAVRNGLVEL